MVQAIDLNPCGGLHALYKCRFVSIDWVFHVCHVELLEEMSKLCHFWTLFITCSCFMVFEAVNYLFIVKH